MSLQRRISRKKNRALIGQSRWVLVEGPSDENEWVLEGRHAGQAPDIDGKVYLSGAEALPGTLRKVTFTDCRDYDLVGELSDNDAIEPGDNAHLASPVVSLDTSVYFGPDASKMPMRPESVRQPSLARVWDGVYQTSVTKGGAANGIGDSEVQPIAKFGFVLIKQHHVVTHLRRDVESIRAGLWIRLLPSAHSRHEVVRVHVGSGQYATT